jgi:hypothetical protein
MVLLPMVLLLPSALSAAVAGRFKDEHRATQIGNPRIARTRFKVLIWIKSFGAGVASTSKFLDEQNPKRGQSDQGMFGPKSPNRCCRAGRASGPIFQPTYWKVY